MKRKRFRVVGVVMAALMMLSGCGGKSVDDTGESTTNVVEESAESNTEEGTVSNTEAASADSVLFDGEDTELLMIFPGGNAAPSSLEKVESAMNEVISQYMDAHVKLQILEWGVAMDQWNLILSSGEKVDLLFLVNAYSYVNKGMLTDVTEMLDVYAPEATEDMSAYLNANYVNGKLYGLPTFHDIAKSVGISVRKDILEELGFHADDIKTWDDATELFAAVKETYPNMNVLVPAYLGKGVAHCLETSRFDIMNEIGVGVTYNQTDRTVLNIYATDEYKEICEKAYEWNQAGYFMSDATTNTETAHNLVSAGNTFGYITNNYPGQDQNDSVSCGQDMVILNIEDATITTSAQYFSQWSVPTQCKTPEKAVALLNLLYTNADMQNLFFYGIEDVDYVINEEGQLAYPEGVTSENVGWANEAWVTGNASISHTWETKDADIWEQLVQFNETAKKSVLDGFIYDTSNVQNEATAISNVIAKYNNLLESGAANDVEGTIAEFNKELEAAGIQNVIDDMQNQVDAWAADE